MQSLVVAEGLMAEVITLEIAGGTAAVFSTRSPKDRRPTRTWPPSCRQPQPRRFGRGRRFGRTRRRRAGLAAADRHDSGNDSRCATLSADPDAEPLRPAILDGIEAANAAVRAIGTGAATTLSLVEIQGRVVRAYQVGDSAILLAGQRGKLKYQTIAHSPIGYAVEAGLIGRGRRDPPRRSGT